MVCETWLVPFEGYFEDLFGPRPLVIFGGVLVGISWVLNSQITGLSGLYIAQAIGGIGAGAIYGSCVGNAVKWFPDRRGLAAGLTAAGFGIGSALTIVPISHVIAVHGFQSAFLYFGIAQGIIVCICALLLRSPPKDDARRASIAAGEGRQFAPREMLRTPLFWLLYAMFVMMAAGGLMATAQLAPIAKDFGVAKVPVSFFAFTMPALVFALALDRTLNGLTRPFFGWVSDRIGRENTMFIAFGVEGLAILALSKYGHTSGPLRASQRPRLLRLGRDLFAVSGDVHGFLRLEIRDDECRPALYGQGHRAHCSCRFRASSPNGPAVGTSSF